MDPRNSRRGGSGYSIPINQPGMTSGHFGQYGIPPQHEMVTPMLHTHQTYPQNAYSYGPSSFPYYFGAQVPPQRYYQQPSQPGYQQYPPPAPQRIRRSGSINAKIMSQVSEFPKKKPQKIRLILFFFAKKITICFFMPSFI